jgi:hypothetical protein
VYGNGRTALADAMDICAAELEALIDRHFAAKRDLVVEREGNHWVASIGDTVLFRVVDVAAAMRFAHAFAAKTPGVTVVYTEDCEIGGHSMRVDNVVPMFGDVA